MIRFYSPDIAESLTLSETDSGHCCRVLRLREGAEIEVVDGCGKAYRCTVTDANPRHTRVEILDEKIENKHWKPRVTLAVAPTKNMDRIEWLAEKAVEIGVDRLVLINCEHSVRRVVKRERVEKILVSAMKQSLKSHLPELIGLIDIAEWLEQDSSAVKFMGYCDSNVDRIDFAQEYDGVADVSILIGPEGDFSQKEVDLAIKSGYKPVTFGATRLRTETAALYALCAAHVKMDIEGN